jgi:hypothetical protein
MNSVDLYRSLQPLAPLYMATFAEPSTQSPILITLSTSAPAISLSGIPPFTATTTFTNTSPRPIYALISLYSLLASRITVHDPHHWKAADRRIGCFGTISCDEDIPLEHQDAILVRFNPGGSFENAYTFRVWEGVKLVDTHFMREGGNYWLESGKIKLWCMFENDVMDEGMITEEEEKRRVMVEKWRVVEIKPECRFDFTAVT